jgi:hypothetical protein
MGRVGVASVVRVYVFSGVRVRVFRVQSVDPGPHDVVDGQQDGGAFGGSLLDAALSFEGRLGSFSFRGEAVASENADFVVDVELGKEVNY